MSSPANTTNASDADEATSNNNETTEPLSVTFAGVQAVLTEHTPPLNIGRDDLRDLMPLTLADLRDTYSWSTVPSVLVWLPLLWQDHLKTMFVIFCV
ncbi:hypothetical protein ABZX51_005339 [Aspergillus tubingensis]